MTKDDLAERLFDPDEPLPAPDPAPPPASPPAAAPESTAAPPPPEAAPVAVYGEPEPPVPPPSVPTPPPAGLTPEQLGVVLGERDRRQAAEAEAKALRERVAAYEAQRKPPQVPDMIADPEAYAEHQQRTQDALEWRSTLRTSKLIAASHYGAEKVQKAEEWWIAQEKADPTKAQRVMREVHPLDYVVKEYDRQQAIEGIDFSDLAAAVRALAAKAGLTDLAGAAPVTQPQRPAPIMPNRPQLPPTSVVDAASAPGPSTVPAVKAKNREFLERSGLG